MSRNAFFAVGFIKRFQKFAFLSPRKLDRLLVISSKNRNDSSFRKSKSFDNDLAIFDGASSYLHEAMLLQGKRERDAAVQRWRPGAAVVCRLWAE